MRDILNQHESAWRPVRGKIETEGWGARLLSCQDEDGQWAGGAFLPRGFTEAEWKEEGQPWTATCWSLQHLREFGLEPGSPRAQRMIELIRANAKWDHDGQDYWDGEVEECINGRTVADGAYFGIDVRPIVARLVSEVQADGGWNCERCNGSHRSSFDTTINVLEGLLEFERATGGTAQSRAARVSGEEYLLKRRLFRRLSTGGVADDRFLRLQSPNRWSHTILRGLDYFRAASVFADTPPDARLAEAIDHVRSRQSNDGTWPLDWKAGGRVWFDMDEDVGKACPWITLKALRIMKWWNERRQT